MMSDRVPPGVSAAVPNVARMYDYYLGGKDNFASDRAAAEKVLSIIPEIRGDARNSRAFLQRAVRHLRQAGVDQFLDIGSGLPTAGHVHEVIEGAKIVYVDNDSVVLTHSRALLGHSPDVTVQEGDLRRPEAVMERAAEVLDFSRPIALLVVSLLHFVTDAEDPVGIVHRYRDLLPAGSHIVLTHVAPDTMPSKADDVSAVYRNATSPFTARRRSVFASMLDGFDLLEPGVVNTREWRPDPDTDPSPIDGDYHLCAVGRKRS
ncbi:SAM-dependent methyltransferase [Nonomuraea sp. NPDC003560]|uniref:SAM-dependent methyltransferase n=1 Tax=Nonomuraea sp. NPDC003560 TaxID=3364341 RepID=UPI00369DFF1D